MRVACMLVALLSISCASAQTRGLVDTAEPRGSDDATVGCEPADVSDQDMQRMHAQVSRLMTAHGSIGSGPSKDRIDLDGIKERRQELELDARAGRIAAPTGVPTEPGGDAFEAPLDGKSTVLRGKCRNRETDSQSGE